MGIAIFNLQVPALAYELIQRSQPSAQLFAGDENPASLIGAHPGPCSSSLSNQFTQIRFNFIIKSPLKVLLFQMGTLLVQGINHIDK